MSWGLVVFQTGCAAHYSDDVSAAAAFYPLLYPGRQIYGLAAGVWTRDIDRAFRLIKAVEAGVVWVNCFDEGDMTQPFGGYKQSGHARDKCFESLLSYTQTKSAWVRLSH